MAFSKITDVLGGEKVVGKRIRTNMDLLDLSIKGVTKDALLNLSENLSLSMKQMAQLLPVTERTLQRYKNKDHFNPSVSEHIIQLAEVAARGVEVFGDREKFKKWLNHPSVALSGKTPLSLLKNRFGVQLILDELGRIEHGVYA
jgi:putative toxin-antitoxin system antitoxin component (TIGR02293 family)